MTVLLLRIYTPEYKIYKVGSSLEIYIYINMLQDMPLNINYIKRDLFWKSVYFFFFKKWYVLWKIYIYIFQNGMFSELIILQIEEKKSENLLVKKYIYFQR